MVAAPFVADVATTYQVEPFVLLGRAQRFLAAIGIGLIQVKELLA